VFTFRCAGCGKQHVVDEPFGQDYSTPCLRCGEPIHVTPAIVHPAANGAAGPAGAARHGEAITARRTTGVDAESVGDGEGGDVPLAEAELADEGDGEAGDVGGGSRTGRKRQRRGRHGPGGDLATDLAGEDGEGDADGSPPDAEAEPPQSGPDWEASHYPPQEEEKRRSRWPLIAGVTALVLALAGGGAYFFFFARGTPKKTPEKSQVAKSTTKKAAPPGTDKSTEPEKPKGAESAVKPKGPEAIRLSAARLAAELAANAAETNRKYKEALVEVSGLFDKIENRESGKPPARPHALFSCEEAAVYCDLLASPTDLGSWRRLMPGRPFTVRGTYGGDGYLHGCELLPSTPPADAGLKGKEVEVAGFVQTIYLRPDRPFPTVRLEGDTDSIAELDCLFRVADEDEVKKLRAGIPVTVRGACGGRVSDPASPAHTVRIDNCRLIDAPAPPPGVRRLSPADVLRPYEEDLRALYLPPPGAEAQVAEPLSVAQLHQEWAADPKGLEKKYRNKVLVVTGQLLQKEPRLALVLASGDTAHPLRLRCLFDRESFEDLGDGPEFRVRGRFTAMVGGSMMRLDSCRSADAVPRDARRVTADYLPHRPGQQLTYDVAEFPVPGKKEGPVKRVVLLQQEGGKTEAVITHAGTLSGKGLFDTDDSGKWTHQKKATVGRLPGPVYLQRISGGFVEVGQTPAKKDGTQEVVWQSVLKLAARRGDSWRWSHEKLTHEFTVEKFEDRGGRPGVVIKETVTSVADPGHPVEKQHVYVRGVGEVEQRDWLLVTSKERVIVGEKKLVE
jgi:hypothetical protein